MKTKMDAIGRQQKKNCEQKNTGGKYCQTKHSQSCRILHTLSNECSIQQTSNLNVPRQECRRVLSVDKRNLQSCRMIEQPPRCLQNCRRVLVSRERCTPNNFNTRSLHQENCDNVDQCHTI